MAWFQRNTHLWSATKILWDSWVSSICCTYRYGMSGIPIPLRISMLKYMIGLREIHQIYWWNYLTYITIDFKLYVLSLTGTLGISDSTGESHQSQWLPIFERGPTFFQCTLTRIYFKTTLIKVNLNLTHIFFFSWARITPNIFVISTLYLFLIYNIVFSIVFHILPT